MGAGHDVKNAAKHYRDVLGFNVIPLKAGSKVAALQKGHPHLYRRATDEEFESFDFRNVGIVTGEVSGIIVIDEDKRGALEAQGWAVPVTATVKTARCHHYYYKHPGFRVRNRTGKGALAPGVDLKGDGGYVVAPPSIIQMMINEKGIDWSQEHVYEWALSPDHVGVAFCPVWLLDELQKQPERTSSVDLTAHIEDGERNSELTRRAGKLTRVLDSKTTREVLHFINEKYCRTPLPPDEVDSITLYENAVEEPDEVGVLMSDVKSEEVRWLWERRIPLGKLTLLEGDPDWGKSAITMDLAARVTTGRPMPHDTLDQVEPLDTLEPLDLLGGVVILNAEDGLGDTIRPRLEAAEANLAQVLALPPMKDDENIISIPEDIPLIEKATERVGARLLIIDPLSAFMRGDPNKDSDVRKALTPLAKMAEYNDVAVLVVRHFNKNVDTRALYRGGGSIGIIGAARSALAVAQHPNDDELRVLVPQKSNLSKKAQSLTYTIVTAENGAARIEWRETVDLNADELLNVSQGELARAKAWLLEKLKDGPVPFNELEAAAREADISLSTLKRAKKKLPVVSKKDGPNDEWRWHLVQEVQGGQECQE